MTAHVSDNSTSNASSTPTSAIGVVIEETIVAVAVLSLGVVMVVGATGFNGGAGYQVVGPSVFPMIVGGLGLACGVVLTVSGVRKLVACLRRRSAADETDERKSTSVHIGWRGVGLLAGLLAGYALLLVPVGFWQITGLVFATAAKIFGSKRLFRNLVIGYVLALAVYFLFDRVLGVGLPDGYIRIAE